MGQLYWWSRYGNFSPGIGLLPHTGEVVAFYRKKRYKNQADFALASGCKLRTVQEWETAMFTHDHERRIFLAKMLKIPPALLGLDWRLVVYQDPSGALAGPPEAFPDHLVALVEEDSYYHYEDTLIMAWGWFYSGKLLAIADRFERRLRKLEQKIQQVPEPDREGWQWLLCQYLNLSTQIIQHRETEPGRKREALRVNAQALKLATELQDSEILALLLHARASIHDEQGHPVQARVAAQAALDYTDRLGVPLSGNIYLLSANILVPFAANDETLEKQARGWQEKALNMVYKGKIEPDNSFLKLNLAGAHHERAKLFLQLHRMHPYRGWLKEARHALILAWDAFTPEISEWELYFHLTEAQIFKEEHDIQGSAEKGLQALQAARAMQSKKREGQIQALYHELIHQDAGNPYVHHLGGELGIF
ncbi:MAG: hypothetical protein IMW89_16160 [Ktedonobacteraceae bacterium]|nr:hypothetical protein [Ktedonobacteraceae bacterium]